jgi:3-carboxy-cis,cis-muconate cycloisomerase
MPHKQNPVGSVLVTAATERVPGLVSTLLAAMPQEHERAAGAWQAEWEPLTELLRLVAAAAAHTRDLLGGLRVNTGAMAQNLALTGGLIMAESAAAALADQLGRTEAQDLVGQLSRRAVERGTTLRQELLAEPRVRDVLSEQDVVATTEPEDHLGSAGEFVDRALRAHRERSRAWT